MLSTNCLAALAERAGVAAVAVHGRTRSQMYEGKADWGIIKDVKDAIKTIPVIGNGDIWMAEDAKAMMDYTGCDGVMVGRGSEGNPFIFRQIKELFEQKMFVETLEYFFAEVENGS